MGKISLYRNGNAGKVMSIPAPGNLSPFVSITVSPPKGSDSIANNGANKLSGVVLSATLEKAENASLTPTLGKHLYLYVGGESAYKIELSGVAIRNCKNSNNGFDQVISWYENANVKKTGKACKLVFNSKVFKGYLKSFSIGLSQQLPHTAVFTLSFYGILV